MISPNEWQKRALALDHDGIEVNVVGRAGQLTKDRTLTEGPEIKADATLAVTLTFGNVLMGADAVSALRHLLEHVLQDAVGHARASKREELTAEDIEEAWKRQGASEE